MKVKLFFLSLICLLMLTNACTKDELENLPKQTSNILTKSIDNEFVKLSDVAYLLATLDLSQEVLNAVKQGVDRSIYYGQDETYRFKDMIHPDSSKINRLSSSILIDKIKEKMELITYLNDKKIFLTYLSEEDIQIYWPYSDEWDKKTNPVISYCDENEKWSYGYKIIKQKDGTNHIDTVIVDENYIKNNTVWIINKNNTQYNDLPDFEEGVFIKNGVFFYSDIAAKWQNRQRDFSPTENSVSIGDINCKEDYEGLAGGPEFRFFWGHISFNPMNPLAPYIGVNTYSINYTKKQLDKIKDKWERINYCIQPYWDERAPSNYLLVYEQDGGKNKTWEQELTVKGWNGEIYSATVKIPYEKNDDILYAGMLERSEVFSVKNKPHGEWLQYKGNNFLFTLPNGQ